jgi:PIN domain nuclease of toxin-antitoxin system
MRILLDTQCWLWWIVCPERLGETARGLIADARNSIYLSAASTWEIAIKYGIGKLSLPETPMRFIPARLKRDAITALPVTIAHTLRVADLPLHHRDPFDRMIIAQSSEEDIPVMTADIQFAAYDVERLSAL